MNNQTKDLYNISRGISKAIREMPKDYRLNFLRESDPTNQSLENLYREAIEIEDYETCAVAKELILERGLIIPN